MMASSAELPARPPARAFELLLALAGFTALFIAYFAPATMEGRFLAPGDGMIYYVPALTSPWAIWNHDLYTGFPAFADPQALVWSPLRLFGSHYNAAVICVYALAGFFTYCLVRLQTASRLAAIVGGLVYSSGAFLVAHLGHLTIIYTAAWLPLVVWSVERCRLAGRTLAPAIGAVALAVSIFGGHPQIFAYSALLSAAYAAALALLARDARHAPLTVYGVRIAVLFTAAALIACVQVLPMIEIGARSLRTEFTYADFTSYALLRSNLLMLFFSGYLGGPGSHLVPYFGPWNLTELAFFVGALPLALAVVAVSDAPHERRIVIWVAIAAIATLYSLGGSTPLGHVAFALPGLNKFRASGRAVMVATLALAVLAGFGVRAMLRLRSARGGFAPSRWQVVALFAAGTAAALLLYASRDTSALGPSFVLPPWYRNPGILIGLAFMVAAVVALELFLRSRRVAVAGAVLVALTTIDLASFGWFAEWREGPSSARMSPDPAWASWSLELERDHGRLLLLDGLQARPPSPVPNMHLLYPFASVGGYGPLMLSHFAEASNLHTSGGLNSWDNLAARVTAMGVDWLGGGLSGRAPQDGSQTLWVGGDCSNLLPEPSRTVDLPAAAVVETLEIETHLACSPGIPQGTVVARIRLHTRDGQSIELPIRAGIDTAEWAIDNAGVAGNTAHGRPEHTRSYPTSAGSVNWYTARLAVPAGAKDAEVSAVEIVWSGGARAGMRVRSISTIQPGGPRLRVTEGDLVWGDGLHWSEELALPGVPWVRKIATSPGRAWLVDRTIRVDAAQSAAAMRTGRLPDDSVFDPRRVAIVAAPAAALDGRGGGTAGSVRVARWSGGVIELLVDASRDAWLVVAETSYPGWRGEMDGQRATLVTTNHAFLGVPVPAGRHVVRLWFRSRTLLIGAAAALSGILLLGFYAWRSMRARGSSLGATPARASATS